MPLSPISRIVNAAEGLQILEGLPQMPSFQDRVLAVERLIDFYGSKVWIRNFRFNPRELLYLRPHTRDDLKAFEEMIRQDREDRTTPLHPIVTPCHEPLFRVGPVRFYQCAGLGTRFREGQEFPRSPWIPRHKNFTLPNEKEHALFHPALEGAGGTYIGIGSLQNLSLAAAAGASNILLVDWNPHLALTLSILLAIVPRHKEPASFVQEVQRLLDRQRPVEEFLEIAPQKFETLFADQIGRLRKEESWFLGGRFKLAGQLRRITRRFAADPSSFLGNEESYQRVASVVEAGGVSVFHTNFLREWVIDMIYSAMGLSADPIRTVYLSNTLTVPNTQLSILPVLPLLAGPWTDPRGKVLLTHRGKSLGGLEEFKISRRSRARDRFSYYAIPLEIAPKVLSKIPILRPRGRVSPEK